MQYARRIIGFDVRGVREVPRKIRGLPSMVISSAAKISRFVEGNLAKRASEKSL